MITVTHVKIPPMSTIGYGEGFGPSGQVVTFVGDHRPMRDIGEAIQAARDASELPTVDLDEDEVSVLSIEPEERP